MLFNYVPLNTRRALAVDSARLVLNGTSLNSDSALLDFR